MKRILVSIALLAGISAGAYAQNVKAWEGTLDLPTYLLDPAEKAPVFDRDWSYQRARRSVYPYALNDNMTRNREVVTYQALYLENEYVKLCVLPAIGGRLFYAIDKTNGYDIFYHQDCVKPANVGMTGAWISGGVEWNVFHHHRQTSHVPCDWRIVDDPDGSKTIWLGETEYRQRMQWAIGITLHPGISYIEISGRLMNATQNNNSMLYWSNVSTGVDSTYQIIFPQSTEFVQFHCKNSMAHWPITAEPYNGTEEYRDGIDAEWWAAHPCGNSMFIFDQKEDYIAGYDHGKDAGTMLAGNHNINKGGKFWSWGPNSKWDTKILTENAGHYIELMQGAYSDNQPDYNWNFPYESKEFSQYWYGIRNIGGVKAGGRDAAMNMEIGEDGKVMVAVNATSRRQGLRVEVSRAGAPVYSRTFSVAPDSPFRDEFEAGKDVEDVDLTMTLFNEKGSVMYTYTPVHHDTSTPLPEIVDRPKRPKDIANTEECYLVGLRNLQFYNPFVNPVDYFEEVLRRDPGDTRANTQMGVYYRIRGDYEKAAGYLRTAIRRQTKDYTRPKDAEAIYNLGLILKAQGNIPAAIDTLFRATWNYTYNSGANTQLAQIYSEAGMYDEALERLEEAIDYNGRNYQAINLKGLILKAKGDRKGAAECFSEVLEDDPVNALALRETLSPADFREFMREAPESYLELAILYRNNGFSDDAVEILKDIDSRVDYPTVKMWLGYLTGSYKYYEDALTLDTGYCNPFRLETIPVLERASELFPESWKPHYYLGNLLYEKQPDNALAEWKKVIEIAPENAMAWRNIGWYWWLYAKDYKESAKYYLKAIELDPSSALYLEEADQVLEAAGESVQFRHDLLKSHHETAVKRYYPLAGEVITGMFTGDFDYILDLLENCYFPTREGVANFHDIYMDALLLAGADKLARGDAEGAIALYSKAFDYPENHQVFYVDGRVPHDAQVYCALAEAYAALGDAANEKANYEKAVQVNVRKTDYRYWKGVALKALGRKAEAKALFRELVDEGRKGIVTDFVNFYGAEGTTGETVATVNTRAYLTMGLGYKGLGRPFKARSCFKKAVSLKPDNLWADVMLR